MIKDKKAFTTDLLPPGWQWTKINDLCDIVRGSSPRPKGDLKYYGGHIPRLMVEDVTRDGMYVKPKIDFLTEEGAKLSRPMLKGELVMVVSGTPGLPAILEVDSCIHDGFVGFRNLKKENCFIQYLYYFLSLVLYNTDKQATGAIFRNLTTDQVRNIDILLPPIEEQKRIVEILDKKMELIEKLKQLVKKQLLHVKALRQAYLTQAFKIDPLPPGWKLININDLCELRTGGTPNSQVDKYYNNGIIPWLVSGDINNSQIFDCDGRITDEGVQNSNAKPLPINSVLIALNGQGKTRGTVAILRIENATCNQSIVAISPKKVYLLSEFLFFYLKSQYQMIRNLTGDNQRSGLNIQIIKSITVPVAPIEEQKRIVEILDKKMELIEKLENYLSNLEKLHEALPQSYLKLAFSGKLTQDFRKNQNNQKQTESVAHG